MKSILKSIKAVMGMEVDDTSFDDELIIHINSVLTLKLLQLGIGPETGFTISSDVETWDQFLSEEELIHLESVKAYTGLCVKMVFDPPSGSSHMEALKSAIDEYEWRLSIQQSFIKKKEE